MSDTIAMPWLWPDHVIGKRESRRLREEHNAVVNSHDDLLAACEAAVALFSPRLGLPEDIAANFRMAVEKDPTLKQLRAAIAQAKEVQS